MCSAQPLKPTMKYTHWLVLYGCVEMLTSRELSIEWLVRDLVEKIPVSVYIPYCDWKTNKHQYPNLAMLALIYLSAPPSSVESERLFSIGGNIITSKRGRLTAENGERLMFLNFNLRAFRFEY